jgi:hypothetical protein
MLSKLWIRADSKRLRVYTQPETAPGKSHAAGEPSAAFP